MSDNMSTFKMLTCCEKDILEHLIFNKTQYINCVALACMERFERQPLIGGCANGSIYCCDKWLGFRHASLWLGGHFRLFAVKAFPETSRLLLHGTTHSVPLFFLSSAKSLKFGSSWVPRTCTRFVLLLHTKRSSTDVCLNSIYEVHERKARLSCVPEGLAERWSHVPPPLLPADNDGGAHFQGK